MSSIKLNGLKVLDSGPHPFDERVAKDLRKLGQMHFESVHEEMGDGTVGSAGGGVGVDGGRPG
jgi:hypothetical protein